MIWFGNARGLIGLSVDWKNEENKLDYKTVISAVHVNGQEVPGAGLTVKDGVRELSLDASQNNVTIYFSGFTFADIRKLVWLWNYFGGNHTGGFISLLFVEKEVTE